MEYIIHQTPKNYLLFVAPKLHKINYIMVQSRMVLYTNTPEYISTLYLNWLWGGTLKTQMSLTIWSVDTKWCIPNT